MPPRRTPEEALTDQTLVRHTTEQTEWLDAFGYLYGGESTTRAGGIRVLISAAMENPNFNTLELQEAIRLRRITTGDDGSSPAA